MDTKEITVVLNAIQRDIAEVKTSQRVMERDIAHHIKRTDLAEENVDLFRKEMQPVKDHVTKVNGVLKFLGAVSIVLTIIATAAKLFAVV